MNIEYVRAPHRRNDSSTSTPSPNAALLIDFDNVTMGIRSNLGAELRKLLESDIIKGKVAVQRAYADWRRYPQYIVPLSESSIDLIFAPAYGSSRKNATDIRLAIDALELVFTRPEIGVFILLSGDSDFSSLVLKLKEYGKYVIGVGLQESTSDILVQNCDEYYSYNSLSGMTSAEDMDTAKLDPWELVERSLQRMVDRNDVMRSDRLKQVMLEIDPSFDEKSAGFSKFNRFLAEASHRDLVRLRKGENGQYEVAPGTGTAQPATEPVVEPSVGREEAARAPGGAGRGSGRSRSSDRRSSRGSRGGGGRERERPRREEAESTSGAYEVDPEKALRKAYQQLADVVDQLHEGGEPLRDSMAKRKLLERDSTFDEGTLGFRKFSHFLRQAHDEGIVDLIQGEDGNYYLQPAAGEDAHPSRRSEREEGQREGRQREGRAGREGGDRSRRGPSARAEAASDDEEPGETEPAPASAATGQPDESGGEAETGPIAAAKEAARRTLGRFRRGSRGASSTPEPSRAGGRPQIGPVDAGPTRSDEETTSAELEEPEASEATPEPERRAASQRASAGASDTVGERRGLGRYRRGSRGRPTTPARGARPGSAPGPAQETSGSPSGGRRSDGGTSGGRSESEVVDHMIRNYSGVGKRTAEALVGEFGGEVFEVIDHEPERLTEVISQRRADAVVAAREAERDGG